MGPEFRFNFTGYPDPKISGIEFDPGAYGAIQDTATPHLAAVRSRTKNQATMSEALSHATTAYMCAVEAEFRRIFMDQGEALVTTPKTELKQWPANFCKEIGKRVEYWRHLRQVEERAQAPISNMLKRLLGRFSIGITVPEDSSGPSENFMTEWQQFTADYLEANDNRIDNPQDVINHAYQIIYIQVCEENEAVLSSRVDS